MDEVDEERLPRPDWEKWGLVKEARLWMALLLTLDVNPTESNYDRMCDDISPLKRRYLDREFIILHSLWWRRSRGRVWYLRGHPDTGSDNDEIVVDLASLVAVAEKHSWDIPSEMRNALGKLSSVPHREAGADEKKSTTLRKIIAAQAYSLASGSKQENFQAISTLIFHQLQKANMIVGRETINNHLEEAIYLLEESLKQDPVQGPSDKTHWEKVEKLLARPRNQNHKT